MVFERLFVLFVQPHLVIVTVICKMVREYNLQVGLLALLSEQPRLALHHLPPCILENPSLNILQSMFMDEEYAKIIFEVGEQQSNENAEMMGKATSVFPAHRVIIHNVQLHLLDCANQERTRARELLSKSLVCHKKFPSPTVLHERGRDCRQ